MTAPRPGAFVGERGKEGVYIAGAGAPATLAPLDPCEHRAEVQDVRLQEGGDGTAALASVDCYGRAVVAQLRRLEGQPGLQVVGAHALQPQDVLRCVGAGGACRAALTMLPC